MKPFLQYFFIPSLLLVCISHIKAATPMLVQPFTPGPFETCRNEPSNYQIIYVEGYDLTGHVTVQTQNLFEMATSPSGPYTHYLDFTPTKGTVGPLPLYIRIAPLQTLPGSEFISIYSPDAITRKVQLSANVKSSYPSVNLYPVGPVCSGKSLAINANYLDGDPYPVFQWYVNGSPVMGQLPPTVFTSDKFKDGDIVTVEMTSHADCPVNQTVKSNPITIKVNPTPAQPTSNSYGTFCKGYSTMLKASGSSAGTFFWYESAAGGTSYGDPYMTPALTANHVYYLIDSVPSTGCKSVRYAVDVSVSECTGLEEGQEMFTVSVFPNPTKGKVQLELDQLSSIVQVKITNSSGLLINQYQVENTKRLDLELNAEAGVYYIDIHANDRNFRRKVVKE